MATFFVDGVEAEDHWLSLDGEQPIPEGDDILVSLDMFKANEHALLTRNAGRLGVHLGALEQVEEIVDHLDSIALVSLDFPSFSDGSALSKARLLRDRHTYKGEVRAVGDIRIDQVIFMRRCGFDTMVVSHQPTIDALIQVKDPSIDLYYQPAVGDAPSPNGKSWARRRA